MDDRGKSDGSRSTCEACVTNAEGGVDVGDIFIGGAVREMEACWPSSVGPAGAGAKPPSAALAEDRRGEREGKRRGLIASGGDREDVPEALGRGQCPVWACVVEASKRFRWHQNQGSCFIP